MNAQRSITTELSRRRLARSAERRVWRWLAVPAALVCVAYAFPLFAQPSGAAADLAELRAEVETLAAELQADRELHRQQIAAYTAHQQELELALGQHESRVETLREIVAKRRVALDQATTREREYDPAVAGAARVLEDAVAKSMPFRRDERLQDLKLVGEEVDAGRLSASAALDQLWRAAENELVLCEESELTKHVVETESGSVVAEVIKLGMVAMYYQTPTGDYGRVWRRKGTWQTEALSGANATALAEAFRRFEGQDRSGLFELPLEVR